MGASGSGRAAGDAYKGSEARAKPTDENESYEKC